MEPSTGGFPPYNGPRPENWWEWTREPVCGEIDEIFVEHQGTKIMPDFCTIRSSEFLGILFGHARGDTEILCPKCQKPAWKVRTPWTREMPNNEWTFYTSEQEPGVVLGASDEGKKILVAPPVDSSGHMVVTSQWKAKVILEAGPKSTPENNRTLR